MRQFIEYDEEGNFNSYIFQLDCYDWSDLRGDWKATEEDAVEKVRIYTRKKPSNKNIPSEMDF